MQKLTIRQGHESMKRGLIAFFADLVTGTDIVFDKPMPFEVMSALLPWVDCNVAPSFYIKSYIDYIYIYI